MPIFQEITSFLGFGKKPRDAAVAGLPVDEKTQLFATFRAVAATTLPTMRIDYRVFNPNTNTFRSATSDRYTIATNDFTQEPSGTLLTRRGDFSDGELLVSAAITLVAGTVQSPGRLYCALYIGSAGTLNAQLIGDFSSGDHIPTWVAGQPAPIRGPFYGPDVPAKLYTFVGTAANGAGGAGDCSLTVTAAGGGRFEYCYGNILSTDTSARAAAFRVEDGGGNILWVGGFNSALGAGGSMFVPSSATSDAASWAPSGQYSPGFIVVGGSDILFMRLAAASASKGATFTLVLRVWGGAPTFTLAGTNTPTLTTTTSRFESG